MRSPNGAKLAKMLHTTFTDQAKRNEVIDLQLSRSQWWHKWGETTREKLKSLPQSKTNLKSDIEQRISKFKCVLLKREDSEKRPEVRSCKACHNKQVRGALGIDRLPSFNCKAL